MKKRALVVAMAAALVLSQNTIGFAAGSSSSHTSVVSTTRTTQASQTSVYTTSGGEGASTTDVSAVRGEEDAVAGLKEENANQIRQMNKGTALSDLGIKNLDLSGYKLLNKTSAIMTYQKGTKVEKKGNVTVTLSVPNLKTGLTNVEVLFFNNMTGRWQIIKPVSVDGAGKLLSVTIPNSGTVAVIYK